MGNQTSQFETEFYKRYSFIQYVEDKLFGMVKIYRKNIVKFDYIMVMEVPLQGLPEDEVDAITSRLKLVRSYQNETTLRVYHFKVVEAAQIECGTRKMLIYAEYMNRSIFDYLCALRSNPRFSFEVNQIIYVLRNVTKSCITLKRMNIFHPDLSSNKIFLTLEGEALLCPLLYILASLNGTDSEKDIAYLQAKYQKYSICSPTTRPVFETKHQLLQLLLEMTGNLPPEKLQQTKFISRLLQESASLEAFYAQLPLTETETIRIEQMHTLDNASGSFYANE